MLKLTRRIGEAINIGDEIIVTLLSIDGKNIGLRINSGPEVLLISREIGDTILIIESNTSIDLIETKGRQVRFGINAPKEIPVHRKEIYDQIKSAEAVKRKRNQGWKGFHDSAFEL